MRHRLFLQIWFLLCLSACGGGSVALHQLENTKGKMPPGPLLGRLESCLAADCSGHETAALLKPLAGTAGDKLDWERFWGELATRAFRYELVLRHPKLLLDLHEKDCDAYPVFVRFLTRIESGEEYVIGKQRKCDTRLPPRLAYEIASIADKHATGAERESVTEQILHFLDLETKDSHYSAAWAVVLAEKREWIESLGHELLAKKKLEPYLSFQLRRPPQEAELSLLRLARTILPSEELRALWIERFGFDDGMQRLRAALPDSATTRLGDKELTSLTNAVVRALEASPSDVNLLTRFARSSETLRLVWSPRTLAESLAAFDRLLEVAEAKVANLDAADRDTLFEKALGAVAGTRAERDLAWLAWRMAPLASPLAASLEKQRTSIEPEPPFERALRAIAAITHAATPEDRREAARVYCAFLAAQGIAPRDIAVGALVQEMGKGLPVGCFNYRAADFDPVVATSAVPLRASFASALFLGDVDLTLRAPRVRLGTVVAETFRKKPAQISTPTPPTANARVVPLVVGVQLPADTARHKKGTYFFVLHHVVRPARTGEKEPRDTAEGFRGPNLLVRAEEEVPRFSFASLGGPGQEGAPKRPGGRGDTSQVDADGLSDWLRAIATTKRLKVMHPINLRSELNYDMLEDLLTHAERGTSGAARIVLVREYAELLADAERSKLAVTCEELMGRPIDKSDFDTCFRDHLAPKAVGRLYEVLEKSKKDALISRTSIVPELNALEIFRIDNADHGPMNAQGPRGEYGASKIFWNKGEVK